MCIIIIADNMYIVDDYCVNKKKYLKTINKYFNKFPHFFWKSFEFGKIGGNVTKMKIRKHTALKNSCVAKREMSQK